MLEQGSNFVPLSTPCFRTVPLLLMDGRRSTSPTSRPAARNSRFALARPSPSTAAVPMKLALYVALLWAVLHLPDHFAEEGWGSGR